MQFSAIELEKIKNFSNTKIRCNGKIDVKEIIEFKRDEREVFRITAIRDHEELMQWEVLDHSKGDSYFRSANSNQLSSFRWPFYAYAKSDTSIIISNLTDSEFILHHEFVNKESEKRTRIIDINFSSEGNLYVILSSKTDYLYYRLRVK